VRFLSSGIDGLDPFLGGGFRAGSATVVIGPSGTGKTTLGLHFLADGVRRGETALYFGFYEPPAQLIAQGELFGMPFQRWVDERKLQMVWKPPAESILDALAYELVVTARREKATRLVVDGLFGFRTAGYPHRLAGFCAVLNQELRALGITMLMTEEGNRLRLPGIDAQVVSALFDNVVQLRADASGQTGERTIRVRKARQTAHHNVSRVFTITDRGMVLASASTKGGGGDGGGGGGGGGGKVPGRG